MSSSKSYSLLPSPSGAYASMRLEKKIEKWSVILELLNES